MARHSSGGRSARSAPRPAKRPPSQPASNAPAPAPSHGGLGSTMLGAVADGIGWAAGSAIAHRAVDAVVGPRTFRHETVASEAAPSKAGSDDSCIVQSKAFQDCLNGYGDEISKCQVYMNMLAECKRNSGSAKSS